MERFALSRMKEWKENENRKPLIIRGARQVGKTWIMKTFGQQYFEKTAYVNFDNNARMKQVFEGDLDIERLVLAISAETGVSIEAENTLIIFDEVQEVPKALTSLKYFHENAPQYAIVAAGSLLGVALHQGTSFPVGKVDFLDLYPLNFREFLCAMGEKQFVSMLDSCDTQMVTVFKTKYIERLREYYFVGGMPEVVKDFSEKKDYNRVRAIQKNLINYYQQDFSKHAEIKLVPRRHPPEPRRRRGLQGHAPGGRGADHRPGAHALPRHALDDAGRHRRLGPGHLVARLVADLDTRRGRRAGHRLGVDNGKKGER